MPRENNLTGGLRNDSQESSEETNVNPSGLATQDNEDSILSPRSDKLNGTPIDYSNSLALGPQLDGPHNFGRHHQSLSI